MRTASRTTRLLPLTLALWLAAAAVVAAPATPAAAPKSDPAATAAIAESAGVLLQGDSQRAIVLLEQAPATGFVGADADYRTCVIDRFRSTTPVNDLSAVSEPWVREALRLYQDYWWQSLQAPAQRSTQEVALFRQLQTHLGKAGSAATDLDSLEPLLQQALLERGYHAQLGRTLPLRDLMLWHTQTTRYYDVELPEGQHRARVELLDDFASRGWGSYARCGRGGAAGWATAEALYAVVPAYVDGLDSEAFRVVFLGHETQHFADQNAYPGITPWELEYRAKLVELVQAREVSGKRLGYMITAQGDDMDSPHTYANKRVVADLTARLGKAPDAVSIDELQVVARELLLDDTRRRKTSPSNGSVAN
ncbi:hypothetical protein ACFOLC_06000 [Lysobacter cavernae]|uniref:Uncharacterized protein n=1 Tax=Lysobacter cavernae TaxID=1685901 RepID=A0ABV7RLP3_9GAMM